MNEVATFNMISLKDNPPTQSPAGLAIEDFTRMWWVAHTKPRQEKALAFDILRLGGSYFLPMYEVRRRKRGRSWKCLLPLFAGYLFLCGDDNDRLDALKTNRIANMINVADQAKLIDEISAIRRMLASGLTVDPYPSLKKGAACRIRSGPLAGLEGHVERRKDRARFIVNVTILGQGAMVEIDSDLLEPGD